MKKIEICIADDNAAFAKALEKRLNAVDEFNVAYIAENGKELLDYVKAEHPEMIITDIVMPEIDGIEAVRQIKEMKDYSPKIFVVSAIGGEKYPKRLIEMGVNHYFIKPINYSKLIEKLKEQPSPAVDIVG